MLTKELRKQLPVQSNNRNTRKKCEIYSKLTIKHQNGVGRVSFLLTLNIFLSFFIVSLIDFEQVIVS